MYEKIKRFTVWIPILGLLLVIICEKDIQNKSMYDEYFEWGSPLLVLISIFWQSIISAYIILKYIVI